MTRNDFQQSLVDLFNKANQNNIDIGDIYEVLNGQKIIAETILRLSIEKAYIERFDL
jgi:hypothetical protein